MKTQAIRRIRTLLVVSIRRKDDAELSNRLVGKRCFCIVILVILCVVDTILILKVSFHMPLLEGYSYQGNDELRRFHITCEVFG